LSFRADARNLSPGILILCGERKLMSHFVEMDRVGGIQRWEKSYCPYCGVGCGLLAGIQDGSVRKIKGDPDHPSSLGDVCLKAVYLPETLRTADRLLYPHVRTSQDGPFRRATWKQTTTYLARRFRAIVDEHGPEAVAFYGSGQLTTEEYYIANKLVKGFLGTNNFDTNSRLCMASAAFGYKASLGSDGPPASYADIDSADCFLLLGTNTADCHPVIFKRIKERKLSDPKTVTIIAVDPRRTETADFADLHLPIRPGSDIALLNAMLAVLIDQNLVDGDFIARHTEGFRALQETVKKYSPKVAENISGVAECLIVEAALIFGMARSALSLWSMGINQSSVGVLKNNAIVNLHLATGKIGRPGCGPFSLTGQPNAMGGREVGGLSHLLPGYRSVANVRDREAVERYWRVPSGSIAPEPGLAALEQFEALAVGKVKAIWILCTNPAVSAPDVDLVEKALRQAELVVVQDAYHPTATSRFAHVILPAAQWSEKEGVMTNSERRITYMPKLVEPPGEALPDWRIIALFAAALGYGDHFAYQTAEEIFAEFAALTKNTFCDYSGISHQRLQREGPLQWPYRTETGEGQTRLYEDGRFPTASGKAKFIAVEHAEPVEAADANYPLVLTTGRSKYHWHTMTRTGKNSALLKSAPEPILEIHRRDAGNHGIQDADFVEITSRRGKVVVQCRVTEEITRGTCFLPFHWGRSGGFFKAANNLTTSARDPVSRQPELKACAVRVRKILDFPFDDN
jgi:ferredoxin-nitrate reductase